MQKKLIALAVERPPYGIRPYRATLIALALRRAFDTMDEHFASK